MSPHETGPNKVWAQIREMSVETSPFLKAQTLAKAQSLFAGEVQIRRWKWMARFSWAMTTALVVALWFEHEHRNAIPEATGHDFVLHVQLSESEAKIASSVELVLPEGLEFRSDLHPELQKERAVRLPIANLNGGRNRLPFVVKVKKPGRYEVSVHFYNDNNQILKTERYKYKFL